MKKRTKLQKREGIQARLEEFRRFDYDYIPFGTRWFSPSAEYNYRGTLPHRVGSFFVRCIVATVGPLLIKVAYGARVTGREHLKALKNTGAVCICNHISYLDTLFIRQAVGQFRSYHTMAPQNNKTGFGGVLIRLAGLIPFSSNLTAMKNANREIERLLGKKKIVNVYAEQAMWVNYQKPRPMKEGAVFFAVKSDVPLLPIFCTFEKNKRGHMKKLRINILPPIFPNNELPRKARIAHLKARAEQSWKECYERAYEKELVFLPSRTAHRPTPYEYKNE